MSAYGSPTYGVVVDAARVFECPKAALHWEAQWIGPPGISEPTTPRFCPWCGEPLSSHNVYDKTITINGLALSRERSTDRDLPDSQVSGRLSAGGEET